MDQKEVTHKEIYDRLMDVEKKVDAIDKNTAGLVNAFQAAQGAFTVLEFLAKITKPLLLIAAFATALIAAFKHWKA